MSEIRALQTENIEKGSEGRHTEKLESVLYPRKTGENLNAPASDVVT